jgi:hypothetical protein
VNQDFLNQFLRQDTKLNTFQVEYDFSRRVTGYVVYRYERREITDNDSGIPATDVVPHAAQPRSPHEPIKLYHPYNNRECLHCHLGARSFEQGAVHNADPQIMIDIKTNRLSCASAGCHENVHDVSKANQVKYWKPEQ